MAQVTRTIRSRPLLLPRSLSRRPHPLAIHERRGNPYGPNQLSASTIHKGTTDRGRAPARTAVAHDARLLRFSASSVACPLDHRQSDADLDEIQRKRTPSAGRLTPGGTHHGLTSFVRFWRAGGWRERIGSYLLNICDVRRP